MAAFVGQEMSRHGCQHELHEEEADVDGGGNAKRLQPADAFDFFKDHHQDGGPGDCHGSVPATGIRTRRFTQRSRKAVDFRPRI